MPVSGKAAFMHTDSEDEMSGVIGGVWWKRGQGSWHWFERYPEFTCAISICGNLRMLKSEHFAVEAYPLDDPNEPPLTQPGRQRKVVKCARCVALCKKRNAEKKEHR